MIEPILLIQIAIALLLGVLAGCITGLCPGLHVNMLAFFIVSSSAYLSRYVQPITLASFIVAISITHTFIDFIPSIFLGSPDEDTALSILPGHSLLLQGRGHEAVMHTLYGGILGLIVILIFTPIFIFLLPKVYPFLKNIMLLILLFTSFYMLLREDNKVLAFLVFSMSGLIGLSALALPLKESLLPMLTGLFGASSLITSIAKKQKLPKQSIAKSKMDVRGLLKIFLPTSIASSLCSFLPALGSGQAAIIASDLMKQPEKENFLMLVGSINTIVMGLSIISLYCINVKRTGSAVAISDLISSVTLSNLFIFLAVIIVSGFVSFLLGKGISKIFARNIYRINYNKLSLGVLIFLSIVVLAFSGWLGFLVFLVATCTGLYAIASGARRTLLMGCLMLPAILLYLPF